jgi:hypothetical protein
MARKKLAYDKEENLVQVDQPEEKKAIPAQPVVKVREVLDLDKMKSDIQNHPKFDKFKKGYRQ